MLDWTKVQWKGMWMEYKKEIVMDQMIDLPVEVSIGSELRSCVMTAE